MRLFGRFKATFFPHDLGWPGFSCEVRFACTKHRSHLTLTQFARQYVGTGIRRKLAAGCYAVIRTAPLAVSVWGEAFDCPNAA